jgi:hypothetical protein
MAQPTGDRRTNQERITPEEGAEVDSADFGHSWVHDKVRTAQDGHGDNDEQADAQ